MLPEQWEQYATALAQSRSAEAVQECLQRIIAAEDIPSPGKPHYMRAEGANMDVTPTQGGRARAEMQPQAASVHAVPAGPCVTVGFDSRPSSLDLTECAASGIWLLGTGVVCIGMCATPLAHFVVGQQQPAQLEAYFARLAQGFAALTGAHHSSKLSAKRALDDDQMMLRSVIPVLSQHCHCSAA